MFCPYLAVILPHSTRLIIYALEKQGFEKYVCLSPGYERRLILMPLGHFFFFKKSFNCSFWLDSIYLKIHRKQRLVLFN